MPRWFGRRGAPPTPPPSTVEPATPAGPPAWRSLPALQPTVALRAPALLRPGLPELSGTQRLPAAPARPAPGSAPSGRVTGLASARQVAPAAEPAPRPALPDPPVRLVAPVRDRPAASRQELLHATDSYVGAAQEPAQPHRAPAWLRALSQVSAAQAIPGLPPSLAALPIQGGGQQPRRPSTGSAPQPVGRAVPTRRAGLSAPLLAPTDQPLSTVDDPLPLPDRSAPAIARPPDDLGPGQAGGSAAAGGQPAGRRGRARGGLGPPQLVPPDPGPLAGPGAAAAAPPGAPAAAHASVPLDLAQALRSAYGTDVAAVPIRQGEAARQAVAQQQARAYTIDGEIVDGTAQPAADPRAHRALLAHELVHVVQQRDLAGALPAEHSPAGAALESDAVAVEHAVLTGRALPPLGHRRGGSGAPVAARLQRAPLVYATPPATTPSADTTTPAAPAAPPTPAAPAPPATPSAATPAAATSTPAGAATTTGPGATSSPPSFGTRMLDFTKSVGSGTEGVLLDFVGVQGSVFDHFLPQSGSGSGGGSGPGGPSGGGPGQHGQQHTPATFGERMGNAGIDTSRDVGGVFGDFLGIDSDELHRRAGEHSGGGGVDPAHPLAESGRPQIHHDDLDLDSLATHLYDRIRSRLRMELLLDRERAGLLIDFR